MVSNNPNRNRKKLDNILQEPLTKHRVQLNAIFQAARADSPDVAFSMEDLKTFIGTIPGQDDRFKLETQKMLEALQSGKAKKTPEINTPSKQVLWGAGLTFIALNPENSENWENPVTFETLEKSDLWKQLTKSNYAIQELLSHSKNIEEVLRHRKTSYKWGKPGTGVSYDNKTNKISIDFRHCLVTGFEHARSDVCREIGHAYLSRTYPDRMVKTAQLMAPLLMKSRRSKAKKGPELSKKEYKSMRLLSAEWDLQMKMFKAAEGNVANRYVDNLGRVRMQDFGVSLNNSAVTSEGIGFRPPPIAGQNMSGSLARYLNLCEVINLSFFQNNDLFDNTDEAWEKAGVDPKQIRMIKTLGSEDLKEDEGVSHPDFQHLRDICGGKEGLENQQPKHHERLFGEDVIERKIIAADKRRNQIMDYIWDNYAENLMKDILEHTADEIDQELENDDQKQGNKNDLLQDQNNPPEPSEQQDNEEQGEPQKGDGQEQGEPQKGDGQEQGEPQKGDGQEQGEPQKGDGQEQGDPQKGDGQEQGEPQKGDGQEQGEPQNDDGALEDGKLGTDEDSTVPVEDAGDMPDVESPSSSPQEEMSKDDQDGQDSDAQDLKDQLEEMKENLDNIDEMLKDSKMSEDDKEKLKEQLEEMQDQVQDMIDELQDEIDKQQQEQDKKDQQSQDQDGDDGQDEGATADELQDQADQAASEESQDGQGDPSGQDGQEGGDPSQQSSSNSNKPGGDQAGKGKGKSLGELAKQDWTEYDKRIAELRGPIMRTRKMFQHVQDLQMQKKIRRSSKMDILPMDGEVAERFNLEAHQNLILKKAIGSVEESDLKRFRLDETMDTPTEIDILIMVDGSGSMGSSYNVGTVPLDSALQAAAILYEATNGKDMKMNVYVGMWGNDTPPIIIKPGDSRKHIGQAMQSARSGLHSGTDFAPAVQKVAETMSNHHGMSGTLSGFTHVLILSDGDIGDEHEAGKSIATMFKYSDKVTFDIGILKSKTGSPIEKMAKKYQNKKPQQKIGHIIESSGNAVPMSIVGLLLNKIRNCGSFTAVPHAKKRRDMKKAANEMNKNKKKNGGRW